MKNLFLLLMSGMMLIVLGSVQTYACTCVKNQSQRKLYQQAGTVVIGKIISLETIDQTTQTVRAMVEVEQAWKTTVAQQITIITGDSCAFAFEKGSKYLLYLSKTDANDWSTSVCSGNKKREQAGKSLSWLKKHGASGKSQ
ncbi:MAG: hypothetical protein ABI954_14605 [Pyrinomonadaceae bacterium]